MFRSEQKTDILFGQNIPTIPAVASDPNKGKGKAGGRGRGRGRSGGPGSGRWRAEDEPPAEYTTAYIEDHDIRCQWYERYRRILNRLSQVERNNQDRIWFRFRTRSYPHWSGLNRVRHCPNHRTLREFFAFLETQREGELFTSRDQNHVNGNSDETISRGTLVPGTPISNDIAAVQLDREAILGNISPDGNRVIQSYLNQSNSGTAGQRVGTALEGGSVDVNRPSTAAGTSGVGKGKTWEGRAPNPYRYTVRTVDKDLSKRWTRRRDEIYRKLSKQEKDNPQRIWYRFRSTNPPHWTGNNKPKNCPNHRFFREFFAFLEQQRPRDVFASRNPEHLQGKTDEEIRRGTLIPDTECSDEPTDVEQDRKKILDNISQFGEGVQQNYLESTLGEVGYHIDPSKVNMGPPARGRGRGTKRPRSPETYTLTFTESVAQDLPIVMPGTSSSGQVVNVEEDEDQLSSDDDSPVRMKHARYEDDDSSDEDNAGLYVPTRTSTAQSSSFTSQSGPSVTSTPPRLTTTFTEVYEDQSSPTDGSPPKMGENVAYDDLYDD